ncbi:MAG: hypothetical protein V9G13_07980 [Marmoricola sp.]
MFRLEFVGVDGVGVEGVEQFLAGGINSPPARVASADCRTTARFGSTVAMWASTIWRI